MVSTLRDLLSRFLGANVGNTVQDVAAIQWIQRRHGVLLDPEPLGYRSSLNYAEDPLLTTPLPLILVIQKLSRYIKSQAQSGDDSDLIHLARLEKLSKTCYESLLDFYEANERAALRSTRRMEVISHLALRNFIRHFQLPLDHRGPRKPVIAVAIPNGPLLAAVILAVATKYIAAPINPAVGRAQFKADVLQARANAVIVTSSDINRLGLRDPWRQGNDGIRLFTVETDARIARIQLQDGDDWSSESASQKMAGSSLAVNGPEDICLTLFTSGTSGAKKVVPITVHAVIIGAASNTAAWGLGAEDVCLNMMPLYHIGGLIRNIFSPIFSGGSTICCPAFDPGLFWDLMTEQSPTCYYASPSMHALILDNAPEFSGGVKRSNTGSSMRLVCNAAGGLLPSLASRIRDCFNCVVLPSYGMTECMPISSPPLNYALDRLGASGLATGPDIAILDWSDNPVRLGAGSVGRIGVKGGPIFSGYLLPSGELDKSCFTTDGWFDTGDLGYLDEDGYLYVTGRSKEVINRGGELISPLEIENAIMTAAMTTASPLYGRIVQTLAFSVAHDVLQEVVGVLLVCPRQGSLPRPGLRTLHQALVHTLQQAKLPALVVYMDDLPRNNGKLLRIRLAERLGISELTDSTPYLGRHWEARCPEPDTPLSVAIKSTMSAIDLGTVAQALATAIPAQTTSHSWIDSTEGSVHVVIAPCEDSSNTAHLKPEWVGELRGELGKTLDEFAVPTHFHHVRHPLPMTADGRGVDTLRLQLQLRDQQPSLIEGGITGHEALTPGSIEGRVLDSFAKVLKRGRSDIPLDADFFSIGGDSLRAGRLLALLRSEFGKLRVPIPIELIFNHPSVLSLSRYIRENSTSTNQHQQNPSSTQSEEMQRRVMAGEGEKKDRDSGTANPEKHYPSSCTEEPQQQYHHHHPTDTDDPTTTTTTTTTTTYSSTRPGLLLCQLIPMLIVYPLRRSFTWTAFIVSLSFTQNWPTHPTVHGRMLNLTACVLFSRTLTRVVVPWVGIAAKWLIVGRYREGVYPMWGPYHTRWWMAQKIVDVCGLGVFSATNTSRVWYCRLMGASVGKNVTLGPGAAQTGLGEWDLLKIGDGATLDARCLCRPFAGERGASMYLGRIVIGRNACVGVASVVAPGTIVPDGACVGPNSSSWELRDADEAHREVSATRVPSPHWALTLFVTAPLSFLSWTLALVPWFAGLVGLVMGEPEDSRNPLYSILQWFAATHRVGYHYLALVLRTFFSPFVIFGFAVAVRWLLDWMFGPLSETTTTTTTTSKATTGAVDDLDIGTETSAATASASASTSAAASASTAKPRRGQLDVWRMSLMRTLMPASQLRALTELFGHHYEGTSWAIRLLGGKVGKRVYWPGTGPAIGDYHLLDVGDDVVFGSRSHLVTSDGLGSEKITIEDRAMVADRVVVLPGVTVGEQTTLGSGAVTRRGRRYAENRTYVGSRGGDAVFLSSSGAARPQNRGAGGRGGGGTMPIANPSQAEVSKASKGFPRRTASPTFDSMRRTGSMDIAEADKHVDFSPAPAKAATGGGPTAASGGIQNFEPPLPHPASHGRSTPARFSRPRSRRPSDAAAATSAATSATTDFESATPFGRAFYLKQAPYFVLNQFLIFLYSTFATLFTAVYWNVPSISSIQIVDEFFRSAHSPMGSGAWWDGPALFIVSAAFTTVLLAHMSLAALLFVVLAKRLLIGAHRVPGNHDWDASPYCQRWQVFLAVERLRRRCFRGHGILGMLTGTHWLVLYFRALGATIGRDCALFANGRPSLTFTEPDLLTLGDRVVVDDASLVAHVNSRGRFDLNRLEVGNRCVLRSGSRLLSGAAMRDDSCLMEHTLVMAGDVVEEGVTMQGWPAERFTGTRRCCLEPGQHRHHHHQKKHKIGDNGGAEGKEGVVRWLNLPEEAEEEEKGLVGRRRKQVEC